MLFGFAGDYQVSNLGRVKSIGRFIKRVGPHGDCYYHKERILIPSMDSCGYAHVRLAKHNQYTLYKVHRLVASHFLDDYSEDLTVNHINFNKFDNRVENLEMMTRVDNAKAKNPTKFYYYCKELNEYTKRPGFWFKRKGIKYNRYALLKSVNTGCEYFDTGWHFQYIEK